MDVWLDSGVSWHTLDTGSEKTHVAADLVIEGVDQLRGWFQSSLLTSMAIREIPPFRRILVHGFAKDDSGNKMSKSVGNVVYPSTVTDGTLKSEAVGADGLRLWVAMKAAESSGVLIGPQVLEKLQQQIKAIRLILRFILGTLESYESMSNENFKFTPQELHLTLVDKYMLCQLKQFYITSLESYSKYEFTILANNFIQFIHKTVSSIYINCVRDRLYCDKIGSPRHKGAVFTLETIGHVLTTVIVPILPHLVAEYLSHHPVHRKNPEQAFRSLFDSTHTRDLLNKLDDTEIRRPIEIAMRVRALLIEATEEIKDPNTQKMGVAISTSNSSDYNLLRSIHSNNDDFNSELIELTRTSFINLILDENESSQLKLKIIADCDRGNILHCPRCRKFSRIKNEYDQQMYCRRCTKAVTE